MKVGKAIKLTFRNAKDSVKCFFRSNVGRIGWLLLLVLPYVMLFLGAYEAIRRGEIAIGSEIIIPVIIVPLAGLLISLSNKLGNGYDMPLPEKRFTEVDYDGQVSMPLERQEELLLWTADFEDWSERMGLR